MIRTLIGLMLCGAAALSAAPPPNILFVITDDQGGRIFVCSDTDFCRSRRDAGHIGALGLPQAGRAL